MLKQHASQANNSNQSEELRKSISALETGSATVGELQRLAVICSQNPTLEEADSPLGMGPIRGQSNDIWENGLLCYKLLAALSRFLTADKASTVGSAISRH